MTDAQLLAALVQAWDRYRLGDVARLMALARERIWLALPDRNKDR